MFQTNVEARTPTYCIRVGKRNDWKDYKEFVVALGRVPTPREMVEHNILFSALARSSQSQSQSPHNPCPLPCHQASQHLHQQQLPSEDGCQG